MRAIFSGRKEKDAASLLAFAGIASGEIHNHRRGLWIPALTGMTLIYIVTASPAMAQPTPAMIKACPELAEPMPPPDGDVACTRMGCMNGLYMQVNPQMKWPHGQYRFVIRMDGKTVTCQGALPLHGCETNSITCDGEGVRITESGCAMPPETHGFGDIEVETYPTQVSVRIERDGKTLIDQSFAPAYKGFYANGPQCGPACCSASLDLPLKP